MCVDKLFCYKTRWRSSNIQYHAMKWKTKHGALGIHLQDSQQIENTSKTGCNWFILNSSPNVYYEKGRKILNAIVTQHYNRTNFFLLILVPLIMFIYFLKLRIHICINRHENALVCCFISKSFDLFICMTMHMFRKLRTLCYLHYFP